MENVWFTSDLHISHKNILKYNPNRIEDMSLRDENDIEGHDRYILEMIDALTKRGDTLYILGDFVFGDERFRKKILEKIKRHGLKVHLIVGNHDKLSKSVDNLFESVEQIKCVRFKKSRFSFLDDDFRVCMCHYPMLSWDAKKYGVMHLFGHTHSNFLETDDNPNLCMNVGIDNPKAACQLFSLQQVYIEYKRKLNGKTIEEYFSELEKNPNFVF